MTLWIIIVGFIIGFALAFSIGANDVANSFGTSVGSRVLTLRTACILASVFELAGAILVGSKVSSTISKGIIDVALYSDDLAALELGYLAALLGAFIWLMAATLFKLPVSGTHSIVGSVVGFTLVAKGASGIRWNVIGKIVASWFTSPVLSGIISSALYFLLQFTILRLPTHIKQLERGILLLPVIYAITFAVNSFSIFFEGSKLLHFDKIPWWGAVILSLGIGALSAVIAKWIIGPRLKRHIMHRRPTLENLAGSKRNTPTGSRLSVNKMENRNERAPTTVSETQLQVNGESLNVTVTSDGSRTPRFFLASELPSPNGDNASKKLLLDEALLAPSLSHSVSSLYLNVPFKPPMALEEEVKVLRPSVSDSLKQPSVQADAAATARVENEEIEYPGIFQLFAFLQVLTACFGAFAHGGNDVSNAIGPVIGLYGLYQKKQIETEAEAEIWILAIGGLGITLGLWILGRRVIETVGTELTEITPPSGFCIELGAAFTVLIASHISIPVSTTHCKIGSVVFVGLSRGGKKKIEWKLFRNIILAWAVTVPASGLISAGAMWALGASLKALGAYPSLAIAVANASNATLTTAASPVEFSLTTNALRF